MLDNQIYVYDKNMKLLAVFNGDSEGKSENAMRNMMVSPIVHIESNGASTLTFQMLANSEAWQTIKDPENIYYLNDRYYTPLADSAYEYSGEDTARLVTVNLVETWYLLSNKYTQAYNCGIYCQCEGNVSLTNSSQISKKGPISFKAYMDDCSNLGKTISSYNAWLQVQTWERTDKDGNLINYRLIQAENAPKDVWLGAPQIVNVKKLSGIGVQPVEFALENPVRPIMRVTIPLGGETIAFQPDNMTTKSFSLLDPLYDYFQQQYGNDEIKVKDNYYIVPPSELKSVELSYTVTKNDVIGQADNINQTGNVATTSYTQKTYLEKVDFQYASNTIRFKKPEHYETTTYKHQSGNTSALIYKAEYINNETVFNYLTIEFEFPNMGAIKRNTTNPCTLTYGAEVVDEHTFIILPKADTKYKLTINGTDYEDSQVRDSRGVVMPRGSGGYAMWAVLKDTDWSLGICDVIAKDFDPNIDYGCFNVETDMKDVLTIIQNIQSLYGGILDWDSKNKILNYRAENTEDYQAHDDSFNKWTGYVFREGKNMTEQPIITYDNSLITKAYLLGYGNLNVKKVNNDKTYIEDYSYTKDIYEGYLTQELIYDTNDESGQKQLLYWGKKELAKQCRPRKTINLAVTDIRTVNGMEHEVFNINDVVKVYYHDSQDNSEHIEEQRIILWEYNVFAYWDCTVELGEKTRNEIDLFKLVYKKTSNLPNPNGSGQISSNNVYLSPAGGDITSNSVGGRLELISQTTTDNSNAIAGLIIDTSANYSFVQLFAQYQKQTANALTQTYAGLEFYADAKSAQTQIASKYYSDTKYSETHREIIETKAACETYADEVGAKARLYADGLWENIDGDLTDIRQAHAEFVAEVTRDYATTKQVSQYISNINGKITEANASIETLANDQLAMVQQISSLRYDLGESWAYITTVASKGEALATMVAEIEETIPTQADVYAWVEDGIAESGISATVGDVEAYVKAIATVRGAEVHLNGNIYIDSGKTFYYYGVLVGWTWVHTSQGNMRVLGEYDQGQLIIPGASVERNI